MNKKILPLLLALTLLPFAVLAAPAAYESTVPGHNAPITLAVNLRDHHLEKIDIISEHETIGVGKIALARMTEAIVQQQSLAVDTVAGATVTSRAVLRGVEQALKDAGVDLAAWKAEKRQDKAQDAEYSADVVVVGGGGAGLAAAIAAEQRGAKVLVLEKLDILGGSTNVSEGALNAVDPVRQGAQGIEDSTEKFITQTYEGGHKVGDMDLIAYMCENAMRTVEWMESIGCAFKDEVGTATGALWQRSHYPTTPSGNSYIRVFEAYLNKSANITLLKHADATELMVEGGRVVGVKAQGRGGETITARAAKGVVLATGGFGANRALLKEHNTGVWAHVDVTKLGCTNMAPSATGAGIEMAVAIGAGVTGMSDIQLHPCGTPGTGLMENIRTSGRNRVFVNLSGDRFVNEGAARDKLAQAIFDQPEQTYWIVVNAIRYPARDFVDSNGASIQNMAAQGSVIEADTLEDLAAKTGMDAGKLKASVDAYNAVVRGEKEDAFGFQANNKADREMTQGPWYACKKVPTVHHTMGGLRINTAAQVLDTNGSVIPGLYAAGEVTGGIHGSNRLGGNAIADCMTYGRLAGENAAQGK